MTSSENPSGSSVYLYQRVWYWLRQRLPMGSNGAGGLPAGAIISIEISARDEAISDLYLRAKLDDVLDVNLIKEEKAKDTGWKISPCSRKTWKDCEGIEYNVTEFIYLQWSIDTNPAKTYHGEFYIAQIPQTDCDILLGRNTLRVIQSQAVRALEHKVQTGNADKLASPGEKENQAAQEKQAATDREKDIQRQEAKEQKRYEQQERQLREDDDESSGDTKGKNPVR